MSRTLGFIAGLTVPAGLYYLSVVHLQGTTRQISDDLHQQSLRLDEPTRSVPIVLEPRQHDTLAARVRQGWNDGVERGVRLCQETDWGAAARRTGSAVTHLARSGWREVEPSVEGGREALHDASVATGDAARRAGHALEVAAHESGRVAAQLAHKVGDESRQLAHEANVRAQRAGHDAAVEARRLADVAREDTAEAKAYLSQVGRQAETEVEALRQRGEVKAGELRREASRQAREAERSLSSASSKFSTKVQEFRDSAASALHDTKEAADGAMNDARDAARRVEKKAESSLLAAQMKASEQWILAEDRYERLVRATEQKADMKFKELQEQFGGRRIGFTDPNDPTGAAKQVRAAENYNKKVEAPVVSADRTKMSVADSADLLQTAALE